MICPKCGANNADTASFCVNCGTALTAAQPQQPQQPPQPPQAAYVPPQQPPYPPQQPYQQPYQQPQQPPYPQPGYGVPQGGAPIQERNIALCIILTIVTCGIYGIYWMICMVNDLNTAADCPGDTSGGIVFLLGLVTCNIYTLYWLYKAGEKVSYIKQKSGQPGDSSAGILYLLLSFFGLSIVSYCLIQNELNKVATVH